MLRTRPAAQLARAAAAQRRGSPTSSAQLEPIAGAPKRSAAELSAVPHAAHEGAADRATPREPGITASAAGGFTASTEAPAPQAQVAASAWHAAAPAAASLAPEDAAPPGAVRPKHAPSGTASETQDGWDDDAELDLADLGAPAAASAPTVPAAAAAVAPADPQAGELKQGCASGSARRRPCERGPRACCCPSPGSRGRSRRRASDAQWRQRPRFSAGAQCRPYAWRPAAQRPLRSGRCVRVRVRGPAWTLELMACGTALMAQQTPRPATAA